MMSFQPKSMFKIRNAIVTDAAGILAIYKPIVAESITSFEFGVPTIEEMQSRIESILPNFPWLVGETTDGSIAGYAYASTHRVREGYQWIAETGIYLSKEFRGQGVGTLLYTKLCEILKAQGYIYAYAIISGNNAGSVALHKRLGFEYIGKWKNCGNKFGKWCDVSWYSKQLNDLKDDPDKPHPYFEIRNKNSFNIE